MNHEKVPHEKLRSITHLILDVDGVLTDGTIAFSDRGEESKNFNVRDGHGLKMLMRYGIEIMLLTGRISKAVGHRARDLGITGVFQGAKNKADVLDEILESYALDPARIAYMGDDIVDVPVFNKVGFAITVPDAADYIRKKAHYVTAARGGSGAVREVCDMILQAQDRWKEVEARYGIE